MTYLKNSVASFSFWWCFILSSLLIVFRPSLSSFCFFILIYLFWLFYLLTSFLYVMMAFRSDSLNMCSLPPGSYLTLARKLRSYAYLRTLRSLQKSHCHPLPFPCLNPLLFWMSILTIIFDWLDPLSYFSSSSSLSLSIFTPHLWKGLSVLSFVDDTWIYFLFYLHHKHSFYSDLLSQTKSKYMRSYWLSFLTEFLWHSLCLWTYPLVSSYQFSCLACQDGEFTESRQ